MKKYFLLLSLVGLFQRCNQSGNSPGNQQQMNDSTGNQNLLKASSDDQVGQCPADSNMYLTANKAKAMIDYFKINYIDKLTTPKRKFTASSVVDAAVIKAFYKAIATASNNFDGARVYYGASNTKPSQSIFMLTPTLTDDPGKYHPNAWGNLIPVTNPVFKNFNYEQAVAQPLIDSFLTKYREQSDPKNEATAKNKALSSAVWFSKCFWEIMNDFLLNNPKYQGFRLYAAAYDIAPVPAPPGYTYPNQSTVVWVPVDSSGTDRWDVLQYQSNESSNASAAAFGGLNHGELCPRNCVP